MEFRNALSLCVLQFLKQRWHAMCQRGFAANKTTENMNLTQTNMNLKFVVEANFGSQVLQSKGAVLVAFWAPWSKPCQVIDPVLLEVSHTCGSKIEVVKVNADDSPDLSLWFGVQRIPTLLYFEAGQVRGQLVGTVSKDAILNLLARGMGAELQH